MYPTGNVEVENVSSLYPRSGGCILYHVYILHIHYMYNITWKGEVSKYRGSYIGYMKHVPT